MVSFTDHYNAISIDRLSSETKIGKFSWLFNNSLLCKPKFSSATKNFISLFKKKTKKQPLFSKWLWEYSKSHFKENAKIFSKNSTTQENITISRQNLFFYQKHKKTTTLQQVTGEEKPNLVLQKMLELFLKIWPLKKKFKILRLKEDYKTYTKKKTSNQN